jgi:nicotinamide mononucleotide adenylyltransferase
MDMKTASAHGRFQPLHNQHLEYLLAAKRQCEFLWIGITMPDITPLHLNPLGRHRERPEANPLTYFERISLIAEALVESRIERNEFEFVPFPIENPISLNNFLPTNIPCLTTICDQWNNEKIAVLEGIGYSVKVLFTRNDELIRGSDIRKRIINQDETWKDMVPPATVRSMQSLSIRSRLLKLSSDIQTLSTSLHDTV